MSAEIAGFDHAQDGAKVDAAAELVSAVMIETGASAGQAYCLGDRAARYFGQIAFAALRSMDIEVDTERFVEAVARVEIGTLPGGRIKVARRAQEEAELAQTEQHARSLKGAGEGWND